MDVDEALAIADEPLAPKVVAAQVLAAEVRRLRTPMAPMTYGLDDTRALLAAQMRITQHLHEEARKLRAENADLRARITTGGPPAPFTPGWERGPSSRPPTAPPALDEVDLLAVDYTDEPPPR